MYNALYINNHESRRELMKIKNVAIARYKKIDENKHVKQLNDAYHLHQYVATITHENSTHKSYTITITHNDIIIHTNANLTLYHAQSLCDVLLSNCFE